MSLVIVSLISSAVFGAVQQEIASAERMKLSLPAAVLAEQRLETLRVLNRAQLIDFPDTLAAGSTETDLTSYQWKATAGESGQIPGLFDLAVEVVWASGQVDLATLVYRPR